MPVALTVTAAVGTAIGSWLRTHRQLATNSWRRIGVCAPKAKPTCSVGGQTHRKTVFVERKSRMFSSRRASFRNLCGAREIRLLRRLFFVVIVFGVKATHKQ